MPVASFHLRVDQKLNRELCEENFGDLQNREGLIFSLLFLSSCIYSFYRKRICLREDLGKDWEITKGGTLHCPLPVVCTDYCYGSLCNHDYAPTGFISQK